MYPNLHIALPPPFLYPCFAYLVYLNFDTYFDLLFTSSSLKPFHLEYVNFIYSYLFIIFKTAAVQNAKEWPSFLSSVFLYFSCYNLLKVHNLIYKLLKNITSLSVSFLLILLTLFLFHLPSFLSHNHFFSFHFLVLLLFASMSIHLLSSILPISFSSVFLVYRQLFSSPLLIFSYYVFLFLFILLFVFKSILFLFPFFIISNSQVTISFSFSCPSLSSPFSSSSFTFSSC